MTFLEIVLISVALSVDAAVCSIICGKKILNTDIKLRFALIMASTFGIFQFLMPLTGFYCGESVIRYIEEYDHWVGFLLLTVVSLNMLKEAILGEHEEITSLNLFVILSLGIATSIDALAVGFSITVLDSRILYISGVIGIICFLISFSCFMLGVQLSRLNALDRLFNIIGALTLFGIGLGILYEHGVF